MTLNWKITATFGLWVLVGIAKTMALILLLTAPDTRLPDVVAWLALAFGFVAAAMVLRDREPAE